MSCKSAFWKYYMFLFLNLETLCWLLVWGIAAAIEHALSVRNDKKKTETQKNQILKLGIVILCSCSSCFCALSQQRKQYHLRMNNSTASNNHLRPSSCNSAAGGDTRWGPLPAWEAAPALEKYSFQNKVTLQEKVSNFLLLVPRVSTPIPAITFTLLWDEQDGHLPCHHFTGTWDGKKRRPGERGQAFRLSFLQSACFLPCFGAGHGWRWGLWGGERRLAGKPRTLWTGLEEWRRGQMKRSLHHPVCEAPSR